MSMFFVASCRAFLPGLIFAFYFLPFTILGFLSEPLHGCCTPCGSRGLPRFFFLPLVAAGGDLTPFSPLFQDFPSSRHRPFLHRRL